MYDPCFVILTGCAPGGFWLVGPFNDAGKAIEYATEHAECHYYDDVDDYWEVYTCVKPSIPDEQDKTMHRPAIVILPIFDYEDEKAIEETVKAMLWAYSEETILPKVPFKCPKCDKYTLLDLPNIIHAKYDWFCIEGRYADCIPEHSRNFFNALGIEQLQKIHPNNLDYMLQNIIYPDGLWYSMTDNYAQLPDMEFLSLAYADNLYVVIDYHY